MVWRYRDDGTKNFDNIDYECKPIKSSSTNQKSISVIGLDTETYSNGRCFLIATSEGDCFSPDDFPRCFFSRKYRGAKFVCYNLKFDSGSMLQKFPSSFLTELWSKGTAEYDGYVFKYIPHKFMSIRRGKNTITFYDIAGFFGMSLEEASSKYLGEHKIELETKSFTKEYVDEHRREIERYCIQDAVLCKRLADTLIKNFESWGVYPRKLYSTAYIAWTYFKSKCEIPSIVRFYRFYPQLLDWAMRSYYGGKFEVVIKGCGNFWEYDINSAYPYEIANLVDISRAKVYYSRREIKDAVYGFLRCKLKIPLEFYSPIAVKLGSVNIFPAGEFEKIITLQEYRYLKSRDIPVKLIEGWFMVVPEKIYPFRSEIMRLYNLKNYLKQKKDSINYHIIKIFLNSLYGKFLQLTPEGDKWKAGESWNPIYGSVITAKVRIRVSEMQNRFPDIWAVHTDSVISSKPLDIPQSDQIGDWMLTAKGEGVILGSGIYQIGDKCRFRGFPSKKPILEIIKRAGKKAVIPVRRPYSWIECSAHGWSSEKINLFENIDKELEVDFDVKRIWLDDWQTFADVFKRVVYSLPHYFDGVWIF